VRHLLSLFLLVSLIAVGCKPGATVPQSTAGSGPGADAPTGPGKTKTLSTKATRLDVEIVPIELVIKKGEKKKWPITIKRSGGYDKGFTIMLSSSNAGIKVPDEVKVPESKNETQALEVEVVAAADLKGTPADSITVLATVPGFEDPKGAMVKVIVEK